MDNTIRAFLELQDKDIRISNLRRQIQSVPEEKEKIRQELEGTDDSLEQAKAREMVVQKEIHSLEIEISSARTKVMQLQNNSLSVKKNEEYRAILKEIAYVEDKILGLEDNELELWEALDKAKVARAEAQKLADATHSRIEGALADLDVREMHCRAQEAKMLGERKELTDGLDIALLRQYERLTPRNSDKTAFRKVIVPLEQTSCGGCHLSVPPQIANQARKNQLVSCENCGAILYYDV